VGTFCWGELGGWDLCGEVHAPFGEVRRGPRAVRTVARGCAPRAGFDPSWGRLGYIIWLDTAQDLCHSRGTHPLDHTDFTGYGPSMRGWLHRCRRFESRGLLQGFGARLEIAGWQFGVDRGLVPGRCGVGRSVELDSATPQDQSHRSCGAVGFSTSTAGNEHPLDIMDRISKMTRTIPIQRIDLTSIAEAFLDHCVAAHGPPATQISDTGPQFRFTIFQGIRSLLGITNRYSRTYHRQTNGQVERYNRTIVEQLRTFVEDHQYRWDALVSMLTLAFNSRPQQSTEVAPLDSATPKRVGSLSVERVVGSPAPEEQDRSPRGVREAIRARLRNLVHKVRRPLSVAHRRYKRNYDACVRPLNKDIQAGDRVFIEFHARTKQKLGTQAA